MRKSAIAVWFTYVRHCHVSFARSNRVSNISLLNWYFLCQRKHGSINVLRHKAEILPSMFGLASSRTPIISKEHYVPIYMEYVLLTLPHGSLKICLRQELRYLNQTYRQFPFDCDEEVVRVFLGPKSCHILLHTVIFIVGNVT